MRDKYLSYGCWGGVALVGGSLLLYLLFVGAAALGDPFFWLGLLLSLGSLTAARYSEVASNLGWVRLSGGVIFASPFLIAYLGYMFVLVPVNYPPGHEFKETLVPEPGTKRAQKNYRRLNEQFRLWSDRYDSHVKDIKNSDLAPPDTDTSLNKQIQQVSVSPATVKLARRTEPIRSKILTFLAKRPVAKPTSEWGIKGTVLQIVNFLGLNKLELIAVKQRIKEGRPGEAAARYRRLWRAVYELNKSPSSMIELIVTQTALDQLMGVYGVQPRLRDALGSEFFNLVKQTESIQHPAGRRALAFEYVAMKDAARKVVSDTVSFRSGNFLKNVITLFSRWPLYDVERTQWRFHQFYAGLAQLFKPPFHRRRSQFAGFRRTWSNRLRRWRITKPWNMLTNPLGRFLMTRAVPSFRRFVLDTARIRSRLTMVRFIGQHHPPFKDTAIPTDELTGRPYQIDTHTDTYVIRSGFTGRAKDKLLQLTVVTN